MDHRLGWVHRHKKLLIKDNLSVWALSALEWYDEVYCGTLLDSAKSKYESLPEKYKAQVRTKIQVTTAECNEDYLDSFTDKVSSERQDGPQLAVLILAKTRLFLIRVSLF